MTGRPKKPITGDGPVATFAASLRRLRAEAGDPTYREMGRAVNFAHNGLSEADRGQRLPTWECTLAYLRGCGLTDRTGIARWQREHQAAKAAAALFRPADLSTPPELAAALARLVEARALTPATLADRCADLVRPEREPPTRDEIQAVLHDRSRPPGLALTGAVVEAAGGVPADIARWEEAWHRAETAGSADAETAAADAETAASGLPAPETAASWPAASETAASETAGETAAPGSVGTVLRRQLADTRGRALLSSLGVVLVFALLSVLADAVLAGSVALPRRPAVVPVAEPAPPQPAMPIIPSVPAGAGESPRARLGRLAFRTNGLVESARDRVTYIHTKTYLPDPGSLEPEPVVVRDERLWHRPDGSGQRVVTPLDPADHGRGRPEVLRDPSEERFGPGDLAIGVEPPPSDPAVLGGQLSTLNRGVPGPAGDLRAVSEIYRYHDPSPAQRAAILRVLADGVQHYQVTDLPDREGRPGVAVSADTADGIRRTAIFDPETGGLLSYEETTGGGAAGTVTLSVPAVSFCTVYLTRDTCPEIALCEPD